MQGAKGEGLHNEIRKNSKALPLSPFIKSASFFHVVVHSSPQPTGLIHDKV